MNRTRDRHDRLAISNKIITFCRIFDRSRIGQLRRDPAILLKIFDIRRRRNKRDDQRFAERRFADLSYDHLVAAAIKFRKVISNLRPIGDGPVIFDLTLAGYRRSPDLLRLAFEPPLLGATICALLAALLMGVHAAVRFGSPVERERSLALGKKGLADNSAALIAMVGREHRIVPRYALAIRRRVARIIGVPIDTRDDELNALLDRLRRRNDTAQPIASLVAEAGRAEDASDALRVARKLYRWRRDMIHDS